MGSSGALKDVAVIGGGPAGSTVAALLAARGYDVILFEKEVFPRDHVGESLLPYCYGIFEELGVLEELSKRCVRKPGVRFIDADGIQQTTWCFRHVIADDSYLSFHVIRAEFDQVLLENARRRGVEVREGVRVRNVVLGNGGDPVAVDGVSGDATPHRCQARFVVDASGRDAFLANRVGAKIPHPLLQRAALNTHWTGARRDEGLEEGLLQIVYLGGAKKGWLWVIPVRSDRLSIGVVLEHAYIREQKARLLAGGAVDWQVALYRQEVMSSPFVEALLEGAEIAQPLMFNGDYSYVAGTKYGAQFALVGDASAFIDPIFASGVFLSMNSARLVAEAIDTQLGGRDGEAAFASAYRRIDGAYALVDKAIQVFYNPSAINFAQAGAAAPLLHERQKDALAVGHYLIAGDFFERSAEYGRFLDLLQDPAAFSAYKRHVLNRANTTQSCGAEPWQIFPDLAMRRTP